LEEAQVIVLPNGYYQLKIAFRMFAIWEEKSVSTSISESKSWILVGGKTPHRSLRKNPMKSKYLGKSRVFSEWDVMQGQGRTHPN
jgi:hypothetical protein